MILQVFHVGRESGHVGVDFPDFAVHAFQGLLDLVDLAIFAVLFFVPFSVAE